MNCLPFSPDVKKTLAEARTIAAAETLRDLRLILEHLTKLRQIESTRWDLPRSQDPMFRAVELAIADVSRAISICCQIRVVGMVNGKKE